MQHNPAPLKLHFTTVGSGPAVLLVHGMADDSSVWDATVAAAGPNLACTTVDLPGHGRSPTPSEEAAYRREAVLDALDGVLAQIGPAVMVGHSLGGYLALVHHLTRPGVLRGLVLVSTGPGFRDAEAMQRWNDRVHANTPNLDMAPVAATISLHTDSLVIERLSEVSIPVGLVVGSEDRNFFGANDYMETKLSDVRRVTVEGGRHRVMRTHPEPIAEMIHQVVAASEKHDLSNRGGRA